MARRRLSLTVSGMLMSAMVRACRSPEGCCVFEDVVDIAEGDAAVPLAPVDGDIGLSIPEMMLVACRLTPVLLEISTRNSLDMNEWAFNAIAALASSCRILAIF